jgi:hypothetical protein
MPDDAVEAGLSGDVFIPFAIEAAVSLQDRRVKVPWFVQEFDKMG